MKVTPSVQNTSHCCTHTHTYNGARYVIYFFQEAWGWGTVPSPPSLRTILQCLYVDGRGGSAGSELRIRHHIENVVGAGLQIFDLELCRVVIHCELVFHVVST